MKIVLASGNQGKLKEFRQLLTTHHLEIYPQSDFNIKEADETGLTFIENALIKARHASRLSGLPALADDSGLAIDALGGEPGIYSARYAGEHASDQKNIDLVLKKMDDVPDMLRGARFHCVLVYLSHPEDPTPLVCHGQWQGSISRVQAGTGGFGYDPVFWVPDCHCTAAELTKEQKNTRSHRAEALNLLMSQIDLMSPPVRRV